jgi:hypothetical protein
MREPDALPKGASTQRKQSVLAANTLGASSVLQDMPEGSESPESKDRLTLVNLFAAHSAGYSGVMPSPQELHQRQQRDENSARWATVVSDWSPTKQTHDGPYPPQHHPSEQAARNYAADIFRRRKCSVQVLSPQTKGGAIALDLRFDPAEEKALKDQRHAEQFDRPPAVILSAQDAEEEAA